jgi:hypothetical protein
MHSDWFSGIEILQGRWQHAEKVRYCYPSGLEKTHCKWDTYVPLVTKGLIADTNPLQQRKSCMRCISAYKYCAVFLNNISISIIL